MPLKRTRERFVGGGIGDENEPGIMGLVGGDIERLETTEWATDMGDIGLTEGGRKGGRKGGG